MSLDLRHNIQRDFSRLSDVYARLSAARARREMRELVEWIRPRRDDRVLDAACGPGTLVRALARRVAQAAGVDLCRRMIKAAEKAESHSFTPASVSFVVGNVECLPFGGGQFDVVTCSYSFANFPNPLLVLSEFVRVTRPGGRIAVVDVLAPEDSARCAVLNRLEALRGHCYTRVLKRSEFVELFRRAGLRLDCWRLKRRQRHFHEWLRLSPAGASAKRARLLRRMLNDSVDGDKAGLHARRRRGEIVFEYSTGWFLLSRV